jgi:hypothetical protein
MSLAMTPAFNTNAAQMIVDDMGLCLVTLDHHMLLEPIRIASADMDVTSRGLLFHGWPILYKLPGQGDGPKRGSITIQNVDPKISQLIRELKGQISVLFEYISRDDVDSLIFDHGGLFFENIDSDDVSITGEIIGYGSDSQSWPNAKATPARTPGLYVL